MSHESGSWRRLAGGAVSPRDAKERLDDELYVAEDDADDCEALILSSASLLATPCSIALLNASEMDDRFDAVTTGTSSFLTILEEKSRLTAPRPDMLFLEELLIVAV